MALIDKIKKYFNAKADVSPALEQTKRSIKKRTYIEDVVKATGWTHAEAKNNMDIVKTQLGIPYKEYSRGGYYKLTRSQQERKAGKYHRNQEDKEKAVSSIMSKTGKSKNDVLAEIKKYRVLKIYPVDAVLYNKYGMYKMKEADIISLLKALAEIKKITPDLRGKLVQIDNGQLDYTDISDELAYYNSLVEKTLTPTISAALSNRISDLVPEVKKDPERRKAILTDMEMSRFLLRFSTFEYIMYHIFEYDFPGKRAYLCDAVRFRIIKSINSRRVLDIVDNKYALYKEIPDLFGRDCAEIHSMDDLDIFREFVTKHPTFVCKPLNDAMGRGVGLVSVDMQADLATQLQELIDSKRTFIMEERIMPSPRLSVFNKDSLNTVRLMAYYDGKKAVPVSSFFRTGRSGSFVDNAGAGGVYAPVDVETGRLCGTGGDEKGRFYDEHPESHIKYKGFQLPFWDDAVKLVCEASKRMGERCFIGWDVALNENDNWVIVEGNGNPQFVHQRLLGHGQRAYVEDLVGYRA